MHPDARTCGTDAFVLRDWAAVAVLAAFLIEALYLDVGEIGWQLGQCGNEAGREGEQRDEDAGHQLGAVKDSLKMTLRIEYSQLNQIFTISK
jgi:hypothetical protein